MKKLCLISLMLMSAAIHAQHHNMDVHKGHAHDTMVDGKKLAVDRSRFNRFVKDVPDSLVAVISVQGMVCDFCARGIEKAFSKDKHINKIDIDLASGKVLLAYATGTKIERADMKTKMLNNGLNTTDIQIIGNGDAR